MADDDFSWDADDFDPDAGFSKATGDKWAGEDENLQIPAADEPAAADAPANGSSKPKKSKAERIEEKKAARRLQDEEGGAALTEEEEKLKKLMLQKQADLGNALELFGGALSSTPQTLEEFAELGKTLADQVTKFDGLAGYYALIENLVRHSTVSLDSEDCRRLAASLTALAQEKNKLSKEKKGASKKKGKTLKMNKAAMRDEFDLTGNGAGADYEEEYDFM